MGSKSLLFVLWLAGTIVAATVAWQSLGFVTASTEGEPAATASPGGASDRPTTTAPVIEEPPSSNGQDPARSTTTTGVSPSPAGSETADSVGPTPVEQTFDMIGGRTAIRFSASEVVVLWATPAAGYTVDSHGEGGGVEVEFSNGIHESKVEAWWADGPRSELRERAE